MHLVLLSHWSQLASVPALDGEVLVEAALASGLRWCLPEASDAPDLRAALGGATARELARPLPGVSLPTVVGPAQPTSAALVVDAVASLGPGAVVAVHVAELPDLSALLPRARTVRVRWRRQDPPTAALAELPRLLADEHCLDAPTWAGFQLVGETESPHLDRVLADFPALGAA